MAFLITELIENHDKTQFETHAYSYSADDQTPARKRLESAFDHFVDILEVNDKVAASKIYHDKIDILVDLTGYTQSSRTGLVALKPAPISINWLGYPGSMGALAGKPLFDYILADDTIAPNLFGMIFFGYLFDVWNVNEKLIGTIIGTSLLCVAYALNRSKHVAIAPFWYFVGSVLLLWSVFDAVKNTNAPQHLCF